MSGQIIAPAFICTSTIHGGRMLRASWMRKSSVSRTPRFLLSVKEYAKTHVNNGEAFSVTQFGYLKYAVEVFRYQFVILRPHESDVASISMNE